LIKFDACHFAFDIITETLHKLLCEPHVSTILLTDVVVAAVMNVDNYLSLL